MAMIFVHEDIEALARAAAIHIGNEADRALRDRGGFRLGLSGGGTEIATYRALAELNAERPLDWSRVDVLFADERAVPPDHPDSNYGRVREVLLDAVGIPAQRVHRIRGELDVLAQAADEYESHLVEPLDVLTLGIGPDGHTASIFPGKPTVMERVRRAMAVTDSPKPPARRITATPRVIREARMVMVLVAGVAKSHAVMQALEGDVDIRTVPARMLRPYSWFLDRAAASGLSRTMTRQR
jgi:6-phosphogluconolactonase